MAMTEKKRRGFSAMDENKKREIARKGGIAAHRQGTAHRFTSDEAREAGRKGGQSAHRQGLVVPHNFELVLAIWTDTLMMATGKVA
jgi:general stress protein YciG